MICFKTKFGNKKVNPACNQEKLLGVKLITIL